MDGIAIHENLPGDECKKLVENFVGSDRAHENLPGDETDSWKPNQYKRELISAGLYTFSNEECKKLVENFVHGSAMHENLPGDECKNLVENFVGSVGTNETLEGDMTENFAPPCQGGAKISSLVPTEPMKNKKTKGFISLSLIHLKKYFQ